MSEKMKRRDFLLKSSAAVCGAGLATSPRLSFGKSGGPKSEIVEVAHSRAVNGNRGINEAAVLSMVKEGMKALAGSAEPWSKYLSPKDRVGIKISTLGRPLLVTHHELVRALITELTAFGTAENNIIVWDRFSEHMQSGRYALNSSERGVKYLASENSVEKKRLYDTNTVYTSEADNPDRRDEQYGTGSPFSQIFLKDCDKIINLALLKDHALSGVTLCLKHIAFGITGNNSRFHGPSHIGPFIADICARPEVRKKVVLHIVDGLEGCYDTGPAPRNLGVIFAPKTLWFGADPVALDAIGRKAIDEKRKEKGLVSLKDSGRPLDHIELCAQKGLGVSDLSSIRIKKINLS